MYLSGLEIIGFKSFPLKTTVEFANGVTGVVGPNGCGKTNVLDAIRWVLGEQRISILRGGKMEDVIFAGTREMKPLGLAEVSLHIENNRGVLPTEYSNLTITRRLYRSGESEYLLNNIVCRLKDITDLFADTGMGAHAYSAIELDMVEAILSDKADQRRMLFEEAAGITKYKQRKRAALRKLDATENDLLRLSDILAEVSSQVSSLSRQMRRAERYKYYDDRSRTVGQVLLKEKYRRFTEQLGAVRSEKRLNQIKLAELTGEIDRWELAREDYAARSLEVSEQLKSLRQQVEEISGACFRLETEISVTGEKINNAATADEIDRREITAIAGKLEQLGAELTQATSRIDSQQAHLAASRIELERAEKELADKFAELDLARRSTQSEQRDLFEIQGKRSLSEQSQAQLEQQLSELMAQIERQTSQRDGLSGEEREVESKLTATANLQERLRQSISAIEAQTAAVEGERQTVAAGITATQEALAQSRLQVGALEAQIELITRMIAHYEGYGSGVASLFAHREELPGLVDTVANFIESGPDHRKAIEAALGEAAEYIVVTDRTAAYAVIDWLKANTQGRATLVIKSELERWNKDKKIARPGGLSAALTAAVDVVNVRSGYEKLADLLLGDVWIVPDRESAEKLIELGQGDFRVVTQDGELYRARPLHEGGGDKPLPLLGRESDLQRLRESLENTCALTAALENDLASAAERRSELESELSGHQLEMSRLRDQLAETQIELSASKVRYQQIAASLAGLRDSIQLDTERRNELSTRLQLLQSDVSRLAADSEQKASLLNRQSATVESLERAVSETSRRLEELRLNVIRTQTEAASLEGNRRRIEELNDELRSQRQRRQSALEQRVDEVASLRQRLDVLKFDLESQSTQRLQLKAEELALTTKQGELAEKQTEFDQLLKSNRRSRDDMAQQTQQLLISETEIHARQEDIANQLKELYDIDVQSMILPEPLSDETFHELEAELLDCKSKQAQLGMVNMLALEEYEKESERERFLRHQIDDLTAAKDDLKATINRINSTARKMFLETYLQVKENFKRVFAELFQGGEADLMMLNEDDPLESPIEIHARPRGKRFLNITQLSGGEKALTAISLLFAIYLVKPSPFCILDEVDAPLDDANVIRFLRMVRGFVNRTQFIIITHNKRTMEQCDRLYGVTMVQPGVSQVVSVDFAGKGQRTELEALKFTGGEAAPIEPDVIPVTPARRHRVVSDEELGSEFDDEAASAESGRAIPAPETSTSLAADDDDHDDEYDDDDDDDDEDDDEDDDR